MSELKITANILVKPEYKEEVLEALQKIVDETRKEEGNISYELYGNISNNLEYTIIEGWRSKEDIDIHNNSEHFAEFKQAIEGKVNNLVIETLKKIY